MFIAFVIHHNLVGRKVMGGVFEIDVVRLAVGFVTVFLYTDHSRRNIAMQRLKGIWIAAETLEMIFNLLNERLTVSYRQAAGILNRLVDEGNSRCDSDQRNEDQIQRRRRTITAS